MSDMSQANKFLDNVESLVTSKFNSVAELAEEAWDTATEYLGDLNSEIVEFDFNPMSLSGWYVTPPNINQQDAIPPESIDTSITLPPVPITDPLEDIVVRSVDITSLAAIAPVIVFPDDPDPDWPEELPSAPNVKDIDVGHLPNYALPRVPILTDLVTPPLPEDAIPELEATAPTFNVDAPQSIFLYEEAAYSSSLQLATENKLLNIVENGGTGLDEIVEAAIWSRALSRKQVADAAKHEEAERYFSSRGFNIPQGALATRLDELLTERARAEDDINYDIMTEQAKLAQTNTHFAITSAIKYESAIMAYLGGVATRALDSSKYAQSVAIALFNAGVARYNAQLQGYQTAAVVYESRIRASMLILEKYKLKLEGVRLQSDIQKSRIDIYKVEVEGLIALMNLYKVEMEGAKIESDVERLKLEGYREKVRAYKARIDANISRYNAYQAQISGETAKASVYSEQVRAYVTSIQGSKVESDIIIAEAKVKLDNNRSLIEKFRSEIEGYKAEAQTKINELDTKGKVYTAEVGRYEAATKVETGRSMVEIENYKALSVRATATVEQRMMQAKINLEELTRLHNIQVEAIKAGASVSAQMAASALSSVAAGAQLSFRGGFEESKAEIEQTNL